MAGVGMGTTARTSIAWMSTCWCSIPQTGEEADIVKPVIEQKVEQYREALDRQYAHIFNRLCARRRASTRPWPKRF